MMIRKTIAKLAALAASISPTLTLGADAASGWGLLNMTEGVTEISRKIYDLHMLIFWVCVGIAVFVFGWMLWSIIAFRKSKGAVPDTTMVHNTKVEIVWTVIPVGILVAMAVPAASTLIEIEDTTNTELTIKVTGYQWGWHYDYVDDGVSFFSRLDRDSDRARQLDSNVDPASIPNYLLNVDNPLVVPSGTKVRLLVTANDVIHAWWVPAFGMKKDAIPGFVNEMWFQVDADKTGVYRGNCTELCGRDHAFMPIVVDVRNKEEFQTWLQEQTGEQQPADQPAEASAEEAAATTVQAPAIKEPVASSAAG